MTAVQPALDGMPEPPPTARQQQAADFDEWMAAIRPAEEGLLARAGWACSSRPTTHQSGGRRWRGTRAAQRRGDAA